MKKLALLAVFLALPLAIGCAKATATTPPLAPTGARDSVDANANLALQPAHAFALSLSQSIQTGKLQLTTTQLSALNALNGALNVADAAEQAYHNATGESAADLNAAVAAAVAAFNNAQSVFNSITK